MNTGPASPGRGATSRRGWIHFGIAAGVLTIALVGFATAVRHMELVLRRQPVPWPEATRISDDFRLVSFPDQFGPYRLVQADDENPLEGEIVLEDDIMDSLGVGGAIDRRSLPRRTSNWYMIRRYVDTRADENSPYRYWQLEAYYYTGEHRTVPHIPERCLPAAGAEVDPGHNRSVSFAASGAEGAGTSWNTGELRFQRAAYTAVSGRRQQRRRMAVYYVFSVNGEPEHDWTTVRRQLALSFTPYSYFAKVQFSPLGPGDIENFEEADEAAEEFMRHALPHVLEHFPSAQAVRALSEKDPSDQQDES